MLLYLYTSIGNCQEKVSFDVSLMKHQMILWQCATESKQQCAAESKIISYAIKDKASFIPLL